MEWLKQLAPLLGTALGGPLGGAAASFIASKLGLNSETVEAVTDTLATVKLNPDQIASLKEAEIEIYGVPNINLAKWIEKNLKFTQCILEFHELGVPNSG